MPATTDITRAGMKTRGRPKIRRFREAASQTWVPGDLVAVDVNGHLVIAATGGNVYLTNATAKIVGRAINAAGNTTANTRWARVEVFCSGFEIGIPITNANNNAVTAHTLTNGQLLGVVNDNTYGWMVNVSQTTNGAFLITEIDTKETIGSARGYVWGHFPVAANATTTRFDT